MTAALLWYSPAARRSKTGAITATPAAAAAFPRASVDGPGTGSARSKVAVSSFWQKYCERKSSGRHTTSAPERAASATLATALTRFSAGSGPQDIWTKPIENFFGVIFRRRGYQPAR